MANNCKLELSAETHWEKAARTRLGKYLTQVETRFVEDEVDFGHLSRIMDVGAEAGRFSQLSRKGGVETVSIDIDAYGLRRLKLKSGQSSVIQADARKIPLKPEIFDVVFMIEVLDYIPELDQAFAECYQTLKPDSSFVVSFGNKSSLKAKLREFSGKSYQHSYSQVVRSLRKNGFSIKEKDGI